MNFDPNASNFVELKNLDDAETLVARYPDSSKAWILYVVYVLQHGDVTRARSIIRRALKSINFREVEERLNVWITFLNVENNYGSSNSLSSVFKEALLCNDEKKIYNHMVNILVAKCSENLMLSFNEELENLKKLMLKKFKNDKNVWIKFASYYYERGNSKEGREILNRSLESLPRKEHPDILGQLAYLEYKYGDQERSLSLYEDILMKYPKRKNLKFTYISILQELGQHERIERLCN